MGQGSMKVGDAVVMLPNITTNKEVKSTKHHCCGSVTQKSTITLVAIGAITLLVGLLAALPIQGVNIGPLNALSQMGPLAAYVLIGSGGFLLVTNSLILFARYISTKGEQADAGSVSNRDSLPDLRSKGQASLQGNEESVESEKTPYSNIILLHGEGKEDDLNPTPLQRTDAEMIVKTTYFPPLTYSIIDRTSFHEPYFLVVINENLPNFSNPLPPLGRYYATREEVDKHHKPSPMKSFYQQSVLSEPAPSDKRFEKAIQPSVFQKDQAKHLTSLYEIRYEQAALIDFSTCREPFALVVFRDKESANPTFVYFNNKTDAEASINLSRYSLNEHYKWSDDTINDEFKFIQSQLKDNQYYIFENEDIKEACVLTKREIRYYTHGQFESIKEEYAALENATSIVDEVETLSIETDADIASMRLFLGNRPDSYVCKWFGNTYKVVANVGDQVYNLSCPTLQSLSKYAKGTDWTDTWINSHVRVSELKILREAISNESLKFLNKMDPVTIENGITKGSYHLFKAGSLHVVAVKGDPFKDLKDLTNRISDKDIHYFYFRTERFVKSFLNQPSYQLTPYSAITYLSLPQSENRGDTCIVPSDNQLNQAALITNHIKVKKGEHAILSFMHHADSFVVVAFDEGQGTKYSYFNNRLSAEAFVSTLSDATVEVTDPNYGIFKKMLNDQLVLRKKLDNDQMYYFNLSEFPISFVASKKDNDYQVVYYQPFLNNDVLANYSKFKNVTAKLDAPLQGNDAFKTVFEAFMDNQTNVFVETYFDKTYSIASKKEVAGKSTFISNQYTTFQGLIASNHIQETYKNVLWDWIRADVSKTDLPLFQEFVNHLVAFEGDILNALESPQLENEKLSGGVYVQYNLNIETLNIIVFKGPLTQSLQSTANRIDLENNIHCFCFKSQEVANHFCATHLKSVEWKHDHDLAASYVKL